MSELERMRVTTIPRVPPRAAHLSQRGVALLAAVVLSAVGARADGRDEEPLDLQALFREGIPASPFASVVYGYADAMLAHGRDAHGEVKTGLFLGALDRGTLAPLATRPPAPGGVDESLRPGAAGAPLTGANVLLDENLLRLLYFLEGLSSDKRYPAAADEAITWLLRPGVSEATGLPPWGATLSWDTLADRPVSGLATPIHELSRPWLLWPRCFELDAEASLRVARALWTAHAVDPSRGVLAARAGFEDASVRSHEDSLRHAGFCLRAWAEAVALSGDVELLGAIEAVAGRLEALLGGASDAASRAFESRALLSLAIDADGAARRITEPSRSRLRALAARADALFLAAPHSVRDGRGFALRGPSTGASGSVEPTAAALTETWEPRTDAPTTAAVAALCASRYENTGRLAYRDLMLAAADVYLDSRPAADSDAWPLTFAHAIGVELAAYRETSRPAYFESARRLGELAIEKLFDGSPLPRASLGSDHYESTTGADSLVLALAELHLQTLHITAVRAPVNTVDR